MISCISLNKADLYKGCTNLHNQYNEQQKQNVSKQNESAHYLLILILFE